MTNKRKGAWIDVWSINGKVKIQNTKSRINLNSELSDFVDENWKPKAEKGWKSSWVAFAKNINIGRWDGNDNGILAVVESGAMQYHQIEGINKAIEQGRDFAPEQGYVNCLSVGFPTATSDGKVIFQRRASDVHCPNILIHEPCGYMASMNFGPRAECDNPKYANQPKII